MTIHLAIGFIALAGALTASTLPPAPLPNYSDLPAGTSEMVPPDALTIAEQAFPQYQVGEINGLIWYSDILPHVVVFSPAWEPVPFIAQIVPQGPGACYDISCYPPRPPKGVVPEPRLGYVMAIAGALIGIKKGNYIRDCP